MLVDFRVRNFRSFKDERVLSLVASSDPAMRETNTLRTGIKSFPNVVTTAAIYGANASGKSNLLKAILLMRGVVLESASLQPGASFNVQPFRLDEAFAQDDTLFEATILLDGVRYQYGFKLNAKRITGEWLLVYQKTKAQKWLERNWNSATKVETFAFGTHLVGPKRVWQESTRQNALLLSTAVQLNSESLRPLYNWFAESLNIFMSGGIIPFDFSTGMLQSDAGKSQMTRLLTAADIAISSISTEKVKAFQSSITMDVVTGASQTNIQEMEVLMPKFRHRIGDISADFDIGDESEGTQKIFALAGPLFDIINKGRMLVIDELDRSLHPLLVRKIVETFQDPEINRKNAQLLFTTHDTSLLDGLLLRRDQIWFTEKLRNQASDLTPLLQFSPRRGEALERRYLDGRYGGVPILRDRLLTEG